MSNPNITTETENKLVTVTNMTKRFNGMTVKKSKTTIRTTIVRTSAPADFGEIMHVHPTAETEKSEENDEDVDETENEDDVEDDEENDDENEDDEENDDETEDNENEDGECESFQER